MFSLSNLRFLFFGWIAVLSMVWSGCNQQSTRQPVPVATLDVSGLQPDSTTADHSGHVHPATPREQTQVAFPQMPSIVEIDPGTIQNIGVRTSIVQVRPLQRTIRTTGRFQMDERGAHTVSLKVGGWVEKLYIDYEGALIEAGQPLLELYSPELVATQEEYLLAYRNVQRTAQSTLPTAHEDAQRLLEAARRRLAYWDVNDAQIEQLEATQQPQRTLTFYTPAAGEVMYKTVVEGQQITPGQPLMQINDVSRIWLIVDIYEQDLAWVAEGMIADIALPYQPGVHYAGTVDYLYPMLNTATRTAQARVEFATSQHTYALRPGMYAVATLQSVPSAPYPVVPEETILHTGSQDMVIEALGQGRFLPRIVVTGLVSEGYVQVIDGLEGGEEVVTRAQFLIDSEARLQGAVGAMLVGDSQ